MAKDSAFTQEYIDDGFRLTENIVNDAVGDILQVAQKYLNKNPSDMEVLDVGSGRGEYVFALEKRVARVVGVEPYATSYKLALQRKIELGSKSIFYHSMIEDIKLKDQFDLAISLTTIEHMPNARASMEKTIDLLKPSGVLYLSAPNRLWPIECHYHLPFLSWLPLPLANLYLRITGKGTSFQDCSYSRTYWGMKSLFRDLNCNIEFVLPSETSAYLGCGDKSSLRNFIRRIGLVLIRQSPMFWIISKGFFMVIQKKPRTI